MSAVAAASAVSAAPAAERRYVGLVTRTVAFVVDAVIINAVAVVVGAAGVMTLSVLDVHGATQTVAAIVAGALALAWTVGYFVAFWATTGQTIGNRLLRIRVRTRDGADVEPWRALLRFGALLLAALPLLLGFLPILVDDRRRGLHDLLVGTVVEEA